MFLHNLIPCVAGQVQSERIDRFRIRRQDIPVVPPLLPLAIPSLCFDDVVDFLHGVCHLVVQDKVAPEEILPCSEGLPGSPITFVTFVVVACGCVCRDEKDKVQVGVNPWVDSQPKVPSLYVHLDRRYPPSCPFFLAPHACFVVEGLRLCTTGTTQKEGK